MPAVQIAVPMPPFSAVTVASTPGCPRSEYTCRAVTDTIAVPVAIVLLSM
jgi:hypothetical protein